MTHPATAAPATAPARRLGSDAIGAAQDNVIGVDSSAAITLAIPRDTDDTRQA
jgi:hypothetical protein